MERKCRVVDVKIPALSVTEKDTKSMPYGFADTNSSIDRAAKQIKELLPKICKAAEYENSIFSLAKALEKTQKLLNALENVIIPQYQQKIRFIVATLEEREREEFAKLKKVKANDYSIINKELEIENIQEKIETIKDLGKRKNQIKMANLTFDTIKN